MKCTSFSSKGTPPPTPPPAGDKMHFPFAFGERVQYPPLAKDDRRWREFLPIPKLFLYSCMLFLVLSIICTAALILFFKVFERNDVPVLPAIVVNYWTAAFCAFIFLPNHELFFNGSFFTQDWFLISAVLGALFFTIFSLVSISAIRIGISATSVPYKLGLVFPVIFAFAFYKEDFNWWKIAGIVIAFAAVILSSLKKDEGESKAKSKWIYFLPFIIFIGSGACDSLTQFANKKYLMHEGMEAFTFFIFVFAALAGTLAFIWQLAKGKVTLSTKSITGGIAMGIPNYLSFLLLLKALATLSWDSSVIFPLNNLGTVAIATIVSFVAFKEKISKVNTVGLLLAIISIIFIVLSNYLSG